MDLGLKGKKVLITGGSKGIGASCGHAFAAEGASVILVSRSADVLQKTADEIRSRHQVQVEVHAADLSQGPAREGTMQRYGDIDILVNNAGAIPGGSIEDLTMERWIESWQLKVFGYIHMTKLALAAMKPRKAGIICNIIGMAGPAPRWDYVAGSTGNAGLNAFTKAIGSRSVDFGVRVFGINPAATLTDRIMTISRQRAKSTFGDENRWEEALGASSLPFGRIKTPEEVAGSDCPMLRTAGRVPLGRHDRHGWRRAVPALKTASSDVRWRHRGQSTMKPRMKRARPHNGTALRNF